MQHTILTLSLLYLAACAGPAEQPARPGDAPATQTAAAAPAFEVIPLECAVAADVAAALSALVRNASAGGTLPADIEILCDERTNALLVMAPSARMTELKQLVALLDVEQLGSDE